MKVYKYINEYFVKNDDKYSMLKKMDCCSNVVLVGIGQVGVVAASSIAPYLKCNVSFVRSEKKNMERRM